MNYLKIEKIVTVLFLLLLTSLVLAFDSKMNLNEKPVDRSPASIVAQTLRSH